ncbi:MAG: amidophosphoribosyltransferase [Chloroflexi bacterium]|nr:amidophosphoribosyltransferase [Chloroflexota bacterium]
MDSSAVWAEDRVQEHCGVFGIYAPCEDVSRLTFFGLYALQHRGQESAGIATSDGRRIALHTRMGLVAQVFDEQNLRELTGHIAIGHTRYSTTGSSRVENAQPLRVNGSNGPLALAHNGNLVNAPELRADLAARGIEPTTTTDSELIALLCANGPGRDWRERIGLAMPRLKGAFCLTVLTTDRLFAVRDPMGIRPLCLGRFGKGWVVASESCALDTIGAEFIREVEPGELLSIGPNGVETEILPGTSRRALCTFEHIYFARPDSIVDGRLVNSVRERMGRELAREHPVEADLVMPVPDAATAAAVGYAAESGITYREGLVKNRYIGRTFIQPAQASRAGGVALKFNPLPDVLAGKRVILVDDSIVRGTTTPRVVSLLRRAGAKEVHMRITAPPMKFPCYLGVDTAPAEQLIAGHKSVEEIRQHIGADSLGYLSIGGLNRAIGLPESILCNACFHGGYPVPIQLSLDKLVLEQAGGPVVQTGSDAASADPPPLPMPQAGPAAGRTTR